MALAGGLCEVPRRPCRAVSFSRFTQSVQRHGRCAKLAAIRCTLVRRYLETAAPSLAQLCIPKTPSVLAGSGLKDQTLRYPRGCQIIGRLLDIWFRGWPDLFRSRLTVHE
jgi:hypothetical protein